MKFIKLSDANFKEGTQCVLRTLVDGKVNYTIGTWQLADEKYPASVATNYQPAATWQDHDTYEETHVMVLEDPDPDCEYWEDPRWA